MTIFQKIIEWNRERGLLEKGFHHEREVSFIIEELLESTGTYNSITAREKANELTSIIIEKKQHNDETIIDAFADIIVFATGVIAKIGYNPDTVMEEVYKEINSRKGNLVDGKFVKDPTATKYHADFTKCKLN